MLRGDARGRTAICFNETVQNILDHDDEFVDIEKRTKTLEAHGIATQVLSGTNPWTDAVSDAGLAERLARIHNDDLAEIVRRSRGRYIGLATLPLLSPEVAADELNRAMDELGLAGAIVGTNVQGVDIAEPRFLPVFAAASKKSKCVLFLHPAAPLGAPRLREHGLSRSVGYTFETTVSLVRLAYAGIFDRFPDLRLLSAHLGGAFPYLAGRVDTAWSNFEDSRGELRSPPSKKIARALLVDTISYSRAALRFAAEVLGVDKLMFGSDHPFPWGIKEAKESVEESFGPGELDKVYSGNFEREFA